MFEPINCAVLKAFCVGVKKRTYDTCSYMIMSSHKSVLFSRPVAEAWSLGNNPCQSIQSVNHGLLLHEIYQGKDPPLPLPSLLLKPFFLFKFQMFRIRIYLLFYMMKLIYVGTGRPRMFMPYFLIVSGNVFQIRITGWTGWDPNSVCEPGL